MSTSFNTGWEPFVGGYSARVGTPTPKLETSMEQERIKAYLWELLDRKPAIAAENPAVVSSEEDLYE